ncbi:hypothetical protein HBA54_04260 [Pelagibius litoralis]|uniref:Myb-like domain-containing protein n=1 Tax=Pelagibius litoralis TaxID=374515 RepID=A0A967C5H7_9PROT|nr:hypothetical protein [Pelagibius litoralis]NIA67796.1 hypothetical protein [Pelagibius litoralis]
MTDKSTEGGILVNMPGGGSKWVARPDYEEMGVPLRSGDWTSEEEYLLIKLYRRYGAKFCARTLNRNENSVVSAARRLGIRGSLLKPVRIPLADTLGRVA